MASTSSWNANSPSPRTMKSACCMPSSGRKLVCVPPMTAIAPASRTRSASRYDCGAVDVMAEIATRSAERDRKSTRLNSSHGYISYAVFCLKKKKHNKRNEREHRVGLQGTRRIGELYG